jgi:MFS family permease
MKWLYIGGIVLFEAGSALCGGAPNMDALILGRVIAGVGGTGIYLGSLNYMTALTSPHKRGVFCYRCRFFLGCRLYIGSHCRRLLF